MIKLTGNLSGIKPDPIRDWIRIVKELGAQNLFTIGEPDAVPKKILKIYAKAVYAEELSSKTSYPPVTGEDSLKKNIVKMERNFNEPLKEEDAQNLYITLGASQALQFVFSLFDRGSQILVNVPGWGTIFNMTAHSGNVSVPVQFFDEKGNFVQENAEKALTEETQAIYVNSPSNPSGVVLKEKGVKGLAEWALSHNLQIISDSPYKYLIYDREKTPYCSFLSLGEEANRNTTTISSFSKIIKPDIRLGFTRISPQIMSQSGKIQAYFRNLGAGTPRAIQVGANAVLEYDSELSFLKRIVSGYRRKGRLISKRLREYGCSIPQPADGGYMMFAKTPDDLDGDDFVRKMAAPQYKIGFIPGSSFGGGFEGFQHLRKYFRVGFGGGWSPGDIEAKFLR